MYARTRLEEIDGERLRFRATVRRYGGKSVNGRVAGYRGCSLWTETMLLNDIKIASTAEYLSDHVWITVGKWAEKLNAVSGDIIEFDARVDSYYSSKGLDWHLERPTKCMIVGHNSWDGFKEETASYVGSGVSYAQKLRERYRNGHQPQVRVTPEGEKYLAEIARQAEKEAEEQRKIEKERDTLRLKSMIEKYESQSYERGFTCSMVYVLESLGFVTLPGGNLKGVTDSKVQEIARVAVSNYLSA